MSAPTDLKPLSHQRGELREDPAASIYRMDVELGRPVDVNSAYRDWDEQQEKYDEYLHFLRYGRPWAPLALPPNMSWHCKGMAVDTDDNPTRNPDLTQLWAENGWRFVVPSEPWHAQYYAHLDKNRGKPASDGSMPFDPDKPTAPIVIEGDEDMLFLYVEDSVDGNNIPGWILINTRTNKHKVLRDDGSKTQQERANSWARAWGPARKCKRQDMLNAMAVIRDTNAE